MTKMLVNFVTPFLLLATGAGLFAWQLSMKEPPKAKEFTDPTPTVELVAVGSPPEGGFGIEVNGTVVPKREISVSAEIQGRVVKKSESCWAGRAVKRGDLLMELDSRPLDLDEEVLSAEADQLQADLEQLDVEIENTKDLVELAQRDLTLQRREQERVNELGVQRVATLKERDQAESSVLTARQNLQQLLNNQRTFASRRNKLEAQLSRVEAQVEQVRYDRERTVIKSPVNGRIVEVLVEEGGYARPGDSLIRIEDNTTMEVRCSLQLEDLYWLAGGRDPLDQLVDQNGSPNPYEIPRAAATISRTLEGDSRTWQGRLARTEGIGIDERTRTLPCRIEIPEPGGLRRGMFVSVTLRTNSISVPMVSIPRTGFRPNNTLYLFEDGKLSIRQVIPVSVTEDYVLIRGDGPGKPVTINDQLIISPLESPVDRMAVKDIADVSRVDQENVASESSDSVPNSSIVQNG